MSKKKPTDPKQRGPSPERLVIENMGWEEAARRAVRKPRPTTGWPTASNQQKPRKKPKP